MKFKDVLGCYSNNTILITGGAGCIGRTLIMTLLKANPKQIVVLDDLSAAYEWNIPKDERVFFLRGSVLDEVFMKRAFSFRPQYVFHLAAHFANQNSVDNPETDLLVNGLGTLRTLEYANLAGVKKFVFASSGCSVYGNNSPLPLKEDYISLHLDTPYQINKLLGELYCNYFNNYYHMPVTVARFFNVYGPGEVPGKYRNVIPNFIWWSILGEPLPITGTGEETRDYTFVEDIVDGALRMGVVREAVGEAINLASETETRVIDLANWINEINGHRSEIVFRSKREWDQVMKRRASIEKAKKILGYAPKTDVKSGLKMTYDWIIDHRTEIEANVKF
jgi:UDP-glucose 4-epimerase